MSVNQVPGSKQVSTVADEPTWCAVSCPLCRNIIISSSSCCSARVTMASMLLRNICCQINCQMHIHHL